MSPTMGTFDDNRPLPGGPFCIDLLNTRWGPDGAIDWFDDDPAVQFFAETHRTEIRSSQISATRTSLTQARTLIERIFETGTNGTIDAATTADVNAALDGANVCVEVTPEGPQIVISNADPSKRLAVQALVDAVTLLGHKPDRIRTCEHDDCTLWFLDTSKGGRRRWCSMDQCGNRAKASRHYARSTK